MAEVAPSRHIRLEPFADTFPFTVTQGLHIAALVKRQGPWLAEELPGVARRYRSGIAASRHIARLASHERFKPYVIYDDDKRAIGLGTVCLAQAVVHPKLPDRVLKFHDHDYWLDQALAERTDLHKETAAQLIKRNKGLPIAQKDSTADVLYMHHPVMTVPEGAQNPSYGYRDYGYTQLEEEAVSLAVPEGYSDELGATRDGRPLHMYVHAEDYVRFHNEIGA